MNLQDPTPPVILNPIEIDRAIVDLQAKLLFHLSDFLTQGYARAYRHLNVDSEKRVFVPQVFLGEQQDTQRYTIVTPDNDKEGQCFFLVSEEKVIDFKQGHFNYLSYDVAIIFTINLEKVDSVLLETYYFQQEMVKRVRDVITRKAIGVPYVTTILSTKYNFKDVFEGFEIGNQTQLEKSPLTHFRVDINMLLKEECGVLPIDLCTSALALINSNNLRCGCFIPSLDYTIGNDTDFDCFVLQQKADLTTRLCAVASIPSSFDFDGVSEYVRTALIPAYEFEFNSTITFGAWLKFNTLAPQTIYNKFSVPRGYFIILNADGSIRFDLINNGGASGLSVQSDAGGIVIDTWYFIVCTYNGNSLPSGITIDINNVSQNINVNQNNLGTNTILNNTISLRLGANVLGGGTLNGLMNDMRIWKAVLDATEKTDEYNNGEPNPSPESIGDLVLWMEGAKNSVFGVDTFAIMDSSNTADGFQTVNAEKTDISFDTPT